MAREGLTPREAAVQIVTKLRDAGHTAYLAGGCVRDALLGLVPKDYDVATDAPPQVVRRLFPRSRAVGESFGVVLVTIGGHAIEVATFRAEWGYRDGRRPDHVRFTDAEDDARRRDFTINGLFADPLERDPATGGDRIIDYVGGVADLRAGVVRAIGEPDERFGEDALRMLRAPRIAARLGFEIEPGTAASIRALANDLSRISRERIGMEMRLMMADARRATAAALVQSLRLDAPVLHEDHAEHEPATLGALGDEPSYAAALAAWMLDRYHPGPRTVREVAATCARLHGSVVPRWRRALNLSNDEHDALRSLLRLMASLSDWPTATVAQRKRWLASSAWRDALAVARATGDPWVSAELEPQSARLEAEGVAPPPLVNGDDLIAMGGRPGPQMGRLLRRLYDLQLQGELTTREQALAAARRHLSEGVA